MGTKTCPPFYTDNIRNPQATPNPVTSLATLPSPPSQRLEDKSTCSHGTSCSRKRLIDAFPFVILGFHSDNGSEYINQKVAALLEKLRIEQTISRSRQTNDNAPAESKNASTVCKYLGYSHIPQHFASQVNTFTVEVLSPYLNFHRPCHFPTEYADKKERIRKRYRYLDMMAPYEKLRSLPKAESYLKPGTTLKKLDAIAAGCSDNVAAQRLNEARTKLFQLINKTQQRAA